MPAGEAMLDAVQKTFFGPMRVSTMLDSNGSNTTAVAAVVKIMEALGGAVGGKRIVVTAGTGPVGTRAAGLPPSAAPRCTSPRVDVTTLNEHVERSSNASAEGARRLPDHASGAAARLDGARYPNCGPRACSGAAARGRIDPVSRWPSISTPPHPRASRHRADQ